MYGGGGPRLLYKHHDLTRPNRIIHRNPSSKPQAHRYILEVQT
jgi:hypothetical protein